MININRFYIKKYRYFELRNESNGAVYEVCAQRGRLLSVVVLALGLLARSLLVPQLPIPLLSGGPNQALMASSLYSFNSSNCLEAISKGQWAEVPCRVTRPPALFDKDALCREHKWTWADTHPSCPVSKVSVVKGWSIFEDMKVAFVGDSVVRGIFHNFIHGLDPNYR